MLWSLMKIVLFVVGIAAAAMGARFLLGVEGGVQVRLMGQEYTLDALQSVIALLVLMLGVWLLLKLVSLVVACWNFLSGDETAMSRYFNRNRERKGYDALAQGMMALASGEGKIAAQKAAAAEKYLDKPELTNLLTAQAAELTGDRRKAEETYRKLVQDEKTRFVGVRGIMKQKLADGDTETAMKLAEKAFALRPRHEDTQDTLLSLQAQAEDWKGARETLSAKLKYGSLPRDVHKRRDAVLALTQAREWAAEGKTPEAQEAAIEANRLSPTLVPAATMAARAYIEQNKPRYAARVLKKAWETLPHPEVAAAFAEIEPDETPDQRIKRFSALTRLQPDHSETKMLLSELHIAAEDFPGARRALGDLVETDPTARSVTIMAAIERGEGASDTIVKSWLAKAITASRGPQWVCDMCQQVHAVWVPICEQCGAFDTLSWRTPPVTADASDSAGMQMLPLIIGALEDKTEEEPTAPEMDEVDIPEAELVNENTEKTLAG